MFTYIFTLFPIICSFLSNSVYQTYMSKNSRQLEDGLGQRILTRLSGFSTRLSGFGCNTSGASALEFAIVAGPFLLLLLGIFAVALVFAGNMALENAVAQGARLIRTGQAQTQSFDAARFKTEVCKYLTAPLSCGGLRLDVRTFETFESVDLTNPLDSSGSLKSGFGYAPGVGGEVVVVRAFYEWDLLAVLPPVIRLSNMANGNRLLIATVAFRNEPFKL
jgi:Flp pilus assembly protein TadG